MANFLFNPSLLMWSSSKRVRKILLLGFLIFPTLAAPNELRINDYDITIQNNTLMSVRATERPSNELNLSGLHLEKIDNNAFKNVDNVKFLNLGNNSLSVLPESGLSNLKNLEYLSLVDNRIRNFNGAFVGLSNLKTLNISHNPVESLKYGDLYGLNNSVDIIMLGNSFKHIVSSLYDIVDKDDASEDYEEEMVYGIHDDFDYDVSMNDDSDSAPKPSSPLKFPENPTCRIKVCIVQGKVTLLNYMQKDEVLPSTCREVKHDDCCYLYIEDFGIETFEKGWYQIKNTDESSIVAIFLSGNNITRVTEEILNDLPETITLVDLSRNKIERLESGIMRNSGINNLYFGNNMITDVDDDAFKYIDLSGLNLNGNRLKNTQFVATLPRGIRNLYINRNEITELSKLPELKFNQLINWYMRDNYITTVPRNSLGNLPFLINLDLSNNRIKTLETGCFWGMKSLGIIRLRNNDIADLDAGIFDNLKRLVVLDLGRNKLTKITEGFRDSLPHTLDVMRLDYNLMKSLETGSFVNVPKKLLNLEGNAISKIAKGSFYVPQLYGADLAEAIDITGGLGMYYVQYQFAEAFGGSIPTRPIGIENVNLSKNPIKRLENGALYGIAKGKVGDVFLSETPIEFIQGGLFDDV